MNRICNQCGKTIEVEGVSFCPYCGSKLTADIAPEVPDEEAMKWVRKALAAPNFPKRKGILLKGQQACPDSREIAWELLFIGKPEAKRPKTIDFSIIKSWILEIYWNPGKFSAERKDRLRGQLFDDPELVRTLQMFPDPEKKQREYLERLCKEYVELFLEGNNQVMGGIFGFRLERNKDKRIAVPVAQMITNIRADEKLLPEQREQLWKILYQAYGVRTGGKMEYLDELLDS